MSISFNDTSSAKNGLIQVCEFEIFGEQDYGKISGNANLLATFTRGLNDGLNRVSSLILQSDGRWQWDDTNSTDYPIATTDLVTTAGSEQQDYTLAVSHLKILRVEVKDIAGNWNLLTPIDQADVNDQSLTDFLKTAGMPRYYDKTANSIFLYPKPSAESVTSTGGLRVFCQRPPSYFVTTDTTKTPGFNQLYHKLPALIASRDYALAKNLPIAKGLADRVAIEEDALIADYALRNRDEKIGLTVRRTNYR